MKNKPRILLSLVVVTAGLLFVAYLLALRIGLLKQQPTSTNINSTSWKNYKEDRLGFIFSAPTSYKYISSAEYPPSLSLAGRAMIVTDMQLNESAVPINKYVLYMPQNQGLGSLGGNESPIYKGITLSIVLLTKDGSENSFIENIRTSKNHNKIENIDGGEVYEFQSIFSKGKLSNKLVLVDIIKGKRVYRISAMHLNTPDYDKIRKRIVTSIKFTDTVAKDIVE